jgi:hypothetical protein
MYRVTVYVGNGFNTPLPFAEIDLNTAYGPIEVTTSGGGKLGAIGKLGALAGSGGIPILYAPAYSGLAVESAMAQYGDNVLPIFGYPSSSQAAEAQRALVYAENLRAWVENGGVT